MADKIVVKRDDKVGRFVVAAANLNAGEEIFTVSPVVVGPKVLTSLLCLGCYLPLENLEICSNCSWPVCGDRCSNLPNHKEFECQIFALAQIKFQSDQDHSTQLECITPLRALLVSLKDPERWRFEVEPLESHVEERRKDKASWEAEQNNVVRFLANKCRLREKFTEQRIEWICGVLEVNCFEVLPQKGCVPLRGLYPLAGLLSHNCVPNTTHSIAKEDLSLHMRTTVDVKQGEELFSTYTDLIEPTLLRRLSLKSTKYFDCLCDRCKDPSEMNTHMSTIKCRSCDRGVILSTNPLDDEAEWKCAPCGKTLSGQIVSKLYAKIQEDLANLNQMEDSGEKLEAAEKVLRKYKCSLHPTHAFNVNLWLLLGSLYGRVAGYTMVMLPDILFERKADFCQKLIDVLNVVKPGMTRIKGMALYDLHIALLMLTKSQFQNQSIKMNDFKNGLHRVCQVLEESAIILDLEPDNSDERLVAMSARQALAQLNLSVASLKESD